METATGEEKELDPEVVHDDFTVEKGLAEMVQIGKASMHLTTQSFVEKKKLSLDNSWTYTFLDPDGFHFINQCFRTIENRGLEEQGLYRVEGNKKKVHELLSLGINDKDFNLEDSADPWETSTITNAAKRFFWKLKEPLMTFELYSDFIVAAQLETIPSRISKIADLIEKLPESNRAMLKVLCDHLEKVASKADKNKMTVFNLATCLGPALLRKSEADVVTAAMEIKYVIDVIEILIQHCHKILRPAQLGPAKVSSTLSSTPVAQRKVSAMTSGL